MLLLCSLLFKRRFVKYCETHAMEQYLYFQSHMIPMKKRTHAKFVDANLLDQVW